MTPQSVIDPPRPQPGGRLAALVGAPAAAALLLGLAAFEGYSPAAYRDLAGIPTACWGDTSQIEPGRTYSRAECEARLERQALAHTREVLRCTPGLARRPNQLIAAASLAYNIGPRAWCGSTAARRFNAGDWRGGCDAFLMWNRAGGRVVRGLVNRRKAERALCLRGLETGGRA